MAKPHFLNAGSIPKITGLLNYVVDYSVFISSTYYFRFNRFVN